MQAVNVVEKTLSQPYLDKKKPQTGLVSRLIFGPNTQFQLSAALSLDGTMIFATRDSRGGSRLVRRSDGQELLKFAGDLHNLRPFAFSDDSRHLAVGSTHGRRIVLWDLPEAQTSRELKLPDAIRMCRQLVFHPNGDSLLCVSDEAAALVRLSDGQVTQSFGGQRLLASDFSADGRQLLATSADGNAVLLNVDSGQTIRTFARPPAANVRGTALSPNDALLAVAQGNSVRLWDCRSGGQVRTWRAHAEPLTFLTFTADSSRLLTASEDGTLGVWEPSTGELIKRLARDPATIDSELDDLELDDLDLGLDDGLTLEGDDFDEPMVPTALGMAVHGTKHQVVTIYDDDRTICWDLTSGEPVWEVKVPEFSFATLVPCPLYSADEQTFLLGAILYDANTGKDWRINNCRMSPLPSGALVSTQLSLPSLRATP